MPRINLGPIFRGGVQALKQVDNQISPINIDGFPNIRKTLAVEAFDDSFVQNINKTLSSVDGGFYKEKLDRIEAGLQTYEKGDTVNFGALDEFSRTGRKDLISRLARDSDTNNKFRSLKTRISDYGNNLKNASKMKQGFRSFFDDDLRAIEFDVSETVKAFENDIVAPLKIGHGPEAKALLKIVSRNPKDLEKYYGVNQESILGDLLGGTNSFKANPILKDFVTNTQKAYGKLNQKFNAKGVAVSDSNPKNLIPFGVPADVLSYKGVDEFESILRQHTNLDDAAIEGIILDYSRIKDKANMFSVSVAKRDYKFKDGNSAVAFFKSVNGWNGDTNMMAEYVNAIRRQIHSTSVFSAYGNNPLDMIKKSVNHFKAENPGIASFKGIDEALENYQGKLLQYNKSLFTHDDQVVKMGRLMSNFTGIATGAPATAVFRNNFIDFEGHAGAIGAGIYNADYGFGQAVAGSFRNLKYMATHAFKGREQRKAVDKVLDIMGFSNSFDMLSFSALGLFENVTDTLPFIQQQSKGLLDKSNDLLHRATSNLYQLSGNNSLIDSRRARSLISFQQLWTRHFDNFKGYDEWFDAMSIDNPHQMRQFAGNMGIDKQAWEFLQKAKRMKLDSGIKANAQGKIAFDDIPDFLTRQGIVDTDDAIARQFKRANETPKQFKERVGNLWQRMIYNNMQDHTPAPTYTDSISRKLVPESPLLYIALRGALKYIDVANAQFINLRSRIARTVYGDTTQYAGFDKSMLLYSKAFMYYLSGAIAVKWGKDVNANRKPTNFRDPRNIAPLLASTGFGGYINTLATQAFNVYGEVGTGMLTATPLGGTQDKVSNIFKSAFKKNSRTRAFDVARSVSAVTGYSKLWAVKGLLDYTFRNTLLTPAQNTMYLNRLEKYGREPLLK